MARGHSRMSPGPAAASFPDPITALSMKCWPMSQQGQNRKYSPRAHIVCFAPNSGLKSDIASLPKSARSGHPLACSITSSATRHDSDVGSQYAETIKFCFGVAYFESASGAFLALVRSVRESCRPRITGNAPFTSSRHSPASHLSPFRDRPAIRHNWKCRSCRLPGHTVFLLGAYCVHFV
jgi:hypothetical protein